MLIRTFGLLHPACALFLLGACMLQDQEPGRPDSTNGAVSPLLLISIDGFRHDYFGRAELPALDRLVSEGLKADSLMHVFPTKTFSAHYSMVTGLYAENTGVVANSMWDPKRRSRFSLGDRDAVMDGYWYDGEPIWNTVERAGRVAATYFWPGSEARIDGIRPTHWKPYAGDVSHAQRIEQVLAWLDKPAGERPAFITLYFSVVDSVAHARGPSDPAVERAMEDVDEALQWLLAGLEDRGLLGNMHILVTSDHGMTQIDTDRYILLDDYLDLGKIRISDRGPAAQIWAGELDAGEIYNALDGAHPRMRVWMREDIPARYHFRHHQRIADVLAEADPGWMISTRSHVAGMRRGQLKGMHGWDPAWLEMHGILVAHGPAFAAQSEMPAARSIDLYPLMAELLALDPAATDGSLTPFVPVLDDPDSARVATAAWDCGGEHIAVRSAPGSIGLHFRGRTFALPRQPAASGSRYADTGVEFSNKGESARVRIDGRQWRDCRRMDAAADWARAAAAGRAFGNVVPQAETLALSQALARARPGEPVVLEGRVSRVCQNRGCWAAFTDGKHVIRVVAADHGFVLPFDASGTARAFGRLERIQPSPAGARHPIDHDESPAGPAAGAGEYRLIATGIQFVD